MPSSPCPGCSRDVYFEVHELPLLVECAQCSERFTIDDDLEAQQFGPSIRPGLVAAGGRWLGRSLRCDSQLNRMNDRELTFRCLPTT